MKKFKNREGSDLFNTTIVQLEKFYEQVQKGTLNESASISPDILGSEFKYEIIYKYFTFLYALYQAKFAELTGGLIPSR